jgi:peptide chain release factor subunit 1
MLTEQDLRELVAYKTNGSPVVSVYLSLDPTQHVAERYKLRLRGLLKDLGSQVAPEDQQAIEQFIDYHYDWSGRGLALFSAAANGYWRSFALAVPVRSTAVVAPQPYVKPLTHLFDRYGRYGVVVVDKVGARLLHFQVGQLIETSGTLGADVRRIKRGAGTTITGRRAALNSHAGSAHFDATTVHNMKDVIAETEHFCLTQDIRDLVIGGTEDNLAQFKTLLPKALQEKVRGTFRADMNMSAEEIRRRSLEVIEQGERVREQQIVDAVITAAAKGSNGVVRLDDTLEAVRAGRVQTLVVAEGFHAPGYQCQGCAYVSAQRLDTCPFCSQTFVEIPDAVESAIHLTLSQSAEVEVVRDNPALERAGMIGALLRY